jgi:hypothetical protein
MEQLKSAGFKPGRRIPVSFFRLGVLKDVVPTGILVGLDSLLQYTGMLLTPSIFVRSVAVGETPDHLNTPTESLFLCPETGADCVREGDILTCRGTGLRYAIRDGIYDFKAPLD